jgi:hypothetical protein
MRAFLILVSMVFIAIGLSGCDSKTCKSKGDCGNGEICREHKCQKAATGGTKGGATCVTSDDCDEGHYCGGTRRCTPMTEEMKKRAAAEENEVEEAFSPDSDREKLLLFKDVGKQAYLDTLSQRKAVFVNINSTEITDAGHRSALRGLLKKLEEFQIGVDPEELETAPKLLCALIEETRLTGNKLWTEAADKVKKYDADLDILKPVDDECRAKSGPGKKPLKRSETARCNKNNAKMQAIEADREHMNNTKTVVGHFGLVLKNIIRDGYNLAHYGAKRTQAAVKECLTPLQKKKYEFDITEVLEAQFARVIKRASTYAKQ